MSENIRQHKRLACGEGLVEVPAIETPFRQCEGESIPRGQLLDSQRAATKSGKTNHGYEQG